VTLEGDRALKTRKASLARVVSSVLLTAAVAAMVVAAPALAATWTTRQLPGAAAETPLFGISCPSTSLCVAVGGGNTIASSVDPAGGPGAWSVVNPGGAGFPNQNEIKGVSCPSPQLCVAASFEGLIYTSTDPTGGTGAWSIANLSLSGPKVHLYGVSCPSPTFCAASAGGAKILTSTNPAGGPTAWVTTQLPSPLELRGISCPSPAFCVAVGDDGNNIRPEPTDRGEILSSSNPLGGTWQQVEVPGVPGNLYGVSCPSPALCISGNTLGNLLVSSAPTGPASAWRVVDGGGSVQITDVDCVSVSRCVAVDNNADVLTSTNPTGGASDWTFTNLIPYTQVAGTFAANAMWGVSCPSLTFCAISGGDGQVFTSEEPFAAPSQPVAKKHKRRLKKGPKRPRVELSQRPFPAIELERGKLNARFRFYAADRAPVRGFVCKIDERPLRRCRSPKVYRVGVGRHRFQVRAIGWSGLKGPAARAPFRVCRPPSQPSAPPVLPCRHRPS